MTGVPRLGVADTTGATEADGPFPAGQVADRTPARGGATDEVALPAWATQLAALGNGVSAHGTSDGAGWGRVGRGQGDQMAMRRAGPHGAGRGREMWPGSWASSHGPSSRTDGPRRAFGHRAPMLDPGSADRSPQLQAGGPMPPLTTGDGSSCHTCRPTPCQASCKAPPGLRESGYPPTGVSQTPSQSRASCTEVLSEAV